MSMTSKSETTSKPPAWAAPLFKSSATEAQKIYDSGAGGGVYQGDMVADLGSTTQGGIQGVTDAAKNWTDPSYRNMLTAPTSAGQNLGGMASGQNLLSNPHFESALSGQLGRTADQVQSQFSGSGRYGSGANTSALTREIGNIRSNALFNQYNQDSQNMLAANSQIDAARGNQLQAIGAANQGQMLGAQAQIAAGQTQDQNAQNQLQADYGKWMATDMKDWTRLGLLQSAAAGSAGNYGTSVNTQTQPFNPMSAIGGIGSLATKSDARLKENIEPVGVENGQIIFEWNYIGDDQRYRGVMAQMVEDPEAVFMEPDGFYAVDYGRLGLTMEAVDGL